MRDACPELVREEIIYAGRRVTLKRRLLRVRGDVVVREVVHFGEAVAALPITRDGKVILIKQFRAPINAWILEVPAGVVELRRDMAIKDSKRYWRLTPHPGRSGGKVGRGKVEVLDKPQPFLAYVDILSTLIEGGGREGVTKEFSFEDVRAGLVLVPSVLIPRYVVSSK